MINDRIGTNDDLVCISRPRRFGKSYAAKTICAYYDCSVDSHELFDRFAISGSHDYEKHINKYNVIGLDMTEIISTHGIGTERSDDLIKDLCTEIKDEVCSVYPQIDGDGSIFKVLYDYVSISQRKIVFVIDEWDAIIREFSKDEALQKRYIDFLRGLFKNSNFTPACIAAAYITGILPIKKDKSQSALSDLKEYTVLAPGKFAGYIGFNENEVRSLCENADMDFQQMKWWYDGYTLGHNTEIYNPYSVMCALEYQKYSSYWRKTSATESLETYIKLDFDGLQEAVLRLISGEAIEINTNTFENDFITFKSKDDVLTLMIHLGYLTYDDDTTLARIPNEEIRTEFDGLLNNKSAEKLMELVRKSNKILQDTIDGNETSVANAIDAIRKSEYAPTFYNDEQALRYVIKFAYIVCVDKYLKVEELPSGKSIADVVFLPKKRTADPAIVVELKWNKTSEAAIEQIRNNEYPEVLKEFSSEVIMVGINYDPKAKEHSCKIERIEK